MMHLWDVLVAIAMWGPEGAEGIKMAIADPVSAALISSGAHLLGGLFGGKSPQEKAAEQNAQLQRDMFERRKGQGDRATGFSQAQFQAKNALMQKLMQEMGGLTPERPDLASIFRTNTNPFSQGVGGSNVVSSITPTQFTPEQLGANVSVPPAAPPPRQALPRTGNGLMDGVRARVEAQMRERGVGGF